MADDDEMPTVPCPYCRADIAEDAERCPRCENYISAEDAPPGAGKSKWVWALLILTTALMVIAALR